MRVRVLFFGPIVDLLEKNEDIFENQTDLSSLKETVFKKFPQLKNLTFRIAVNQELKENAALKDGDEIALLPPFSGG